MATNNELSLLAGRYMNLKARHILLKEDTWPQIAQLKEKMTAQDIKDTAIVFDFEDVFCSYWDPCYYRGGKIGWEIEAEEKQDEIDFWGKWL